MTLELTNHRDPGIFKTGMDLVINSYGDIATLEGEPELIQDVEKATTTSKQADGYGTFVKKLRGMKNTTLLKSLAILTVLESLQVYKLSQFTALSLGRLKQEALIKTVEFVRTELNEQSITFIIRIVSDQAVEVTV